MTSQLYYVVSLKWTRRDDAYISFWRPANAGYAYPLSWAGKYEEARVSEHPEYYHNGFDTIAVPCSIVDALAIQPKQGMIDNDAGPVVPNTEASWFHIINSLVGRQPKHAPQPQYKGASRQKVKAAA